MADIEVNFDGRVGSSVEIENLSVTNNTVFSIASNNPASTALASSQIIVAHTSVGSVITFTWKNSAGNMFRATLSGASV